MTSLRPHQRPIAPGSFSVAAACCFRVSCGVNLYGGWAPRHPFYQAAYDAVRRQLDEAERSERFFRRWTPGVN